MKKPLISVDALISGGKQLLGRSKEAADRQAAIWIFLSGIASPFWGSMPVVCPRKEKDQWQRKTNMVS